MLKKDMKVNGVLDYSLELKEKEKVFIFADLNSYDYCQLIAGEIIKRGAVPYILWNDFRLNSSLIESKNTYIFEEMFKGYEKIIGEISTYMAEKGVEPKDVNFFKKAMMYGSIKMKTVMNNSRNQIADMMIKGTVMGISELTAMKNENTNLDQDVLNFVEKLLRRHRLQQIQ